MGEEDFSQVYPVDSDLDDVGPEGLKNVILGLQNTVRELQEQMSVIAAEQPGELTPFTTPPLALRGQRGVTLLKRGRNSYDVSLTHPVAQPTLEVRQLIIVSEDDDSIRCADWSGLRIDVMKPYDLQRQIYELVDSDQYNFNYPYTYTYLTSERRLATLKSDPAQEEYQRITRSYDLGNYIVALKLKEHFYREPSPPGQGGGQNAPVRMEFPWIDLNSAGRSWARDTDQEP
jgi:hypothetical protein